MRSCCSCRYRRCRRSIYSCSCGDSGATTLVQLQLQRLGQWQINGGAMALWRRSVSASWSWEVASRSTSPGMAFGWRCKPRNSHRLGPADTPQAVRVCTYVTHTRMSYAYDDVFQDLRRILTYVRIYVCNIYVRYNPMALVAANPPRTDPQRSQ